MNNMNLFDTTKANGLSEKDKLKLDFVINNRQDIHIDFIKNAIEILENSITQYLGELNGRFGYNCSFITKENKEKLKKLIYKIDISAFDDIISEQDEEMFEMHCFALVRGINSSVCKDIKSILQLSNLFYLKGITNVYEFIQMDLPFDSFEKNSRVVVRYKEYEIEKVTEHQIFSNGVKVFDSFEDEFEDDFVDIFVTPAKELSTEEINKFKEYCKFMYSILDVDTFIEEYIDKFYKDKFEHKELEELVRGIIEGLLYELNKK